MITKNKFIEPVNLSDTYVTLCIHVVTSSLITDMTQVEQGFIDDRPVSSRRVQELCKSLS